MKTPRYKISIVGAGNVGFNLSRLLYRAGHDIIQVFDRNEKKAIEAAEQCQAKAIDDLAGLTEDADLFLLCIKDDAIGEVVSKLSVKNKLVCHTAGSVAIAELGSGINRPGVFYPVQTFSRTISGDLNEATICIDATTEEDRTILWTIALSLAARPLLLQDERRMKVHIAAIVVNNFSNHLFVLADEYLKKEALDFSILQPLILQTALKLKEGAPAEMQTGPAVREDWDTLNKHLTLLDGEDELEGFYAMMTRSIIKTKKK